MAEVIFIREQGSNEGTKSLYNKLWRSFEHDREITDAALFRSNRGGEAMTAEENDAAQRSATARFELAFLRGDKRYLEGFWHFMNGTGPYVGMKEKGDSD